MTSGENSELQTGAIDAHSIPEFVNILCAVDGKDGGYAAVEQAAVLAGSQGHLTLLAVTSQRVDGEHRSPAIGPMQAKRIVDRAVSIAAEARVPATVEVDPASPPAQVVLAWSAEHDLLAVGAPASSWLGGLFVAGVGDTAIGELTAPLLFARPTATGRRLGDRILVASDGLEGSDVLVGLAGRLARAHRAETMLLHATGHDTPLHRHRLSEREGRLERQGRELQSSGFGTTEMHIEAGSAHDLIVAAAKEAESSLVVMGTRGLGGLRAIGSVSRRVVHDAHCSVLLVPPERL